MQDIDSDIDIQVRSPSLNETLIVTTKLNATVLSLKQSIEPVHPHHPTADNQRIIYSGKLLQDEELLCNIIKNVKLHDNKNKYMRNKKTVLTYFME